MNILLLYPELEQGTGGIQVHNKQLATALVQLGHNVCVLPLRETARNSVFAFLNKANFLYRLLKRAIFYRPDLILCGHVHLSPVCLVLSKFMKTNYATFLYGIEIPGLKRARVKALNASRKIVVLSNYTKTLLQQNIRDVDDSKTFYLPSTFDHARFQPHPKPEYLMARWNIRSDDFIFLTVARLKSTEQYKGYDRVIQALSEVLKSIPTAKYILAGDGDDLKRVRDLIAAAGVEQQVILTGYIPDDELADYYNLCDAFVMPSTAEGLGIVFLEAAACGKPVIAGSKDGSVDAVINGKLGLLVDPDCTTAIAKAMVRIATRQAEPTLSDPSFLRSQVEEHFGLEKFKERVNHLLYELNQLA